VIACDHGFEKLAETLIHAGADVNIPNKVSNLLETIMIILLGIYLGITCCNSFILYYLLSRLAT